MTNVLPGRRIYLLAALALAAAGSLAFWLTTAGATHQRGEARAAGDAIKDLKPAEVAAAEEAADQAATSVGAAAAGAAADAGAGAVLDRTGPDLINPFSSTPTITVPTAVARTDTVTADVNTLVSGLETRYAAAAAAQSRRITNARAVQGQVKANVDAAAAAALAAKDAVHAAVAGTGTLPLGTLARGALSDLMAASDNAYTKAKETQTKVGELTTAISTATAKLRTARDKARTFKARLSTLESTVAAADDTGSPGDAEVTPAEESRIQTALVAARVARVDLADAVTAATSSVTAANGTPAAVRTAAAAVVTAIGDDGEVAADGSDLASFTTPRTILHNALAVAIYQYEDDPWVKAAEHVHPTAPEPPPPPEPVEVEVQVEVETPLPGAPSAATLTSPARGASGGARPVFTWSVPSGSESYRLYVATDQAFTRESIVEVGILAANERSWAPARSLPSGTYWWRIETRTPFRERFYQLTMSSPASFTVRAAVSVADVSVQFQRQTAKRTALITATVAANVEGATVTVRVKNAQGRTIYTAPSRTLADGERTVTVAWSSVKRQGGRAFTAEVTVQSVGQADTGQATFRTPPK